MRSDKGTENKRERAQEMGAVCRGLCAGPEGQELESHLRQQQRLATLGLLISGIAHEVNNPLTTVMNYAQSIIESAPANSPIYSFAREILGSASWIAALMRNMLGFVREGPRKYDPARMIDIVNATLSLVHPLLSRSQVEIVVSIPPNLPAVLCRSQEIQQVLINLLTNSCDAVEARYPSPDPNKIVSLSLQVVSGDGRAWVRTTVEDRGVGIAPEVQARIFEPLFTGKAETGGTGLGLWICQRIATSHEGSLSVESEAGQFTRFHLDLPVDGEVHERQIRLLEQPESDDACDGPKPAAGRAPEAGRKTDEGRAVS
ncbi:MAG TPA: ATP-binding protein [Kiritimatiellia bacterium]|nr:ATP-binding protein [Kiritimatiellia bacterium]